MEKFLDWCIEGPFLQRLLLFGVCCVVLFFAFSAIVVPAFATPPVVGGFVAGLCLFALLVWAALLALGVLIYMSFMEEVFDALTLWVQRAWAHIGV